MSIGGLFLLFFLVRWLYVRWRGPTVVAGSGGRKEMFSRSGQRVIRAMSHFLLWLFVPTLLLLLGYLVAEWVGRVDLELREGIETMAALLSFPAAFWLIYIAPHWLSWRVLGPAGHLRTAHLVLALGPHPAGKHRAGARALLSAAFAVPPVPPDGRWANPWMALALAVVAERRGERDAAEALLAALLREKRLPRLLCIYGLEIAGRQAAARGDWPAVARLAAAGRGRGARLLRLLARAYRGERGEWGEPVGRRALRFAWLWAAGRRVSRPWVEEAEAGGAASAALPAALSGEPVRSPFRVHLELLALAAAGRPIATARVVALADAWEGRLTPRDQAELLARGLALGVRDAGEVQGAVRQTLFGELERLAAAAVGEWPPVAEGSLAGEVLRRGREQLLAELASWTAAFPNDGSLARPLDLPLAEWQSWMRLRSAVERLAALGGPGAVRVAWYGAGLRLTACNWPFFLGRTHGAAAFWACRAMHLWSAELAGAMADEEIALLSAENAAITHRSLLG